MRTPAPLWRRLAAMVYEALVAAAVVLLAALAFQWVVASLGWLGGVAGWRLTGWPRHVFQLYLALVLGAYFSWFWHHGQTLPMRAWRLRLLGRRDAPPSYASSACRYVAALLLLGPTLTSLIWLREHPASAAAWLGLLPGIAALGATQFGDARSALYDRIASTRLIYEPTPTNKYEAGRRPASTVAPPTTS